MGTAGGAYRGFLFSDMRGFTAFAERHGNVAAASAVARFLEIARKAIASHEGAEIKTEGDAIHAVFPSASSAVLCGLDIIDAAAELNAQETSHPLGLGVGVHAGEAIVTAEGYIGRAVNIAARLCAAARPGEVLVSSTVKGITQSSIPVGFIPKGSRRLKGIEDPILVYAVTRDVNARAPREMRRPLLVGSALAAVVAAVAIVALLGSQLVVRPAPSATATAGPVGQPVALGQMPVGKYRSTNFQPPVTFDIADQGWVASRNSPSVLSLLWNDDPKGSLTLLRVSEVIPNPCVEGGEGVGTGPGTPDVITQLESLHETLGDNLIVSERRAVEVSGLYAEQVEVTVGEGVLAACGSLAGGEASIFAAGGEIWKAAAGETFRVINVVVRDQPVTIVASLDWVGTPPVSQLEALYTRAGRVVGSLRF